jgi:hypothetical protein
MATVNAHCQVPVRRQTVWIPKAEIQDLLCSHDELRAALIIAGKRIRQLQSGRKGDIVLAKLRDVLREARTVRRSFFQD